MILNIILKILIILFVIGCSGNSNKNDFDFENQEMSTPEIQYIEAMKKFDNQELEEAIIIFENIEKIYPLSNEAIQSQIMSAFIDYARLDYDTAILKFNRLIKKYPSLKNIDYIYYMKAICYYEQLSHEGLDGKFNTLALENLNQVINRFPNSEYAKDSHQKIILVKSNIAAKHMTIARFYQKDKKYTAALNRFKIVIDDYSMTKFTPEALHRMVEAYYYMGMYEESNNMAAILGYNYPKSKWYNHSYKLIKKIENKESFFKKIKNVF